jgi:hypothetical protein
MGTIDPLLNPDGYVFPVVDAATGGADTDDNVVIACGTGSHLGAGQHPGPPMVDAFAPPEQACVWVVVED